MNKQEILQAIDDYFKNTTPEEVVATFAELGCEFEDIESHKISYSHLTVNREVVFVSGVASETIELLGMNVYRNISEGFIGLGELANKYCNDDNTSNQLPEAA